MPLLADAHLYVQSHMLCAGDSEIMVFTTGWVVDVEPFTQAQADILVRSIADIFDDIVSSSYTFVGGRVTWKETGFADPIIFDVTDAEAGQLAATPMAPNSAYLFRKNTSSGGRRNRGRFYLPGVLEGDVDAAGFLLPTPLANAQTAAAALLALPTAVPTANVDRAVVLHTEVPSLGTTITSYVCQPKIATQRRRLR